ncbi:MAG: hypothetical protein JNL30_10480 [Rubrivivax sp.]|nr:hypothetical protein [Rubrivivax sp.]
MALLAFGLAGVGAQESLRPISHLGVFSLLGEGIEITVGEYRHDSRLVPVRRETQEVRNVGFDIIAGREVRAAMQRHRASATVTPFGTNTTLPAAEQRHIAGGARAGALPGWIIQAVQQRRLSHVLLLTRQRADVKLPTAEGSSIGRGRVDGLGFYLDPDYKLRDVNTGAVSNGALGPHVVVELTLFDTDAAKVVRSLVIDEQFLLGSSEPKAAVDPWSYLNAEQKIALLREALARSLQRVLPEMLKGM